jgi:hypothetical protein
MSRTYFFWDPLSDNILQERDESGTVTAEYTTEPGLYGNVISQNRGGVESQYHFDPQGSTLALTDDNQQVTDTYAYPLSANDRPHRLQSIRSSTSGRRDITRSETEYDDEGGSVGTSRKMVIDGPNRNWENNKLESLCSE